ncbi:MAG: MarR family transcriptional regulator [Thermoanaerobaculia bacterium]|nr:MarR family transcriptional regulator [Thermoanaerobaculia bacterium]
MRFTLGMRLRHLLEMLDSEVEAAYRRRGLATYRPRFTPVIRAVDVLGPCSIRKITSHSGMTHSAVSQTVAQMRREGLLHVSAGDDRRERRVALTASARRIVPTLKTQWTATNAAAAELDEELTTPLSVVIEEAIAALEQRSFGTRIAELSFETREESTR